MNAYTHNQRKPTKLSNERIDQSLPKGYERLEDYRSSSEKILVRCNKGHEYRSKPQQLLKGTRCRMCYRETRRLTEEEIQERLPNGYTRVGQYKSLIDKMHVRCDRGHEFDAALVHMMRKDFCCSSCRSEERKRPVRIQKQLQEGWRLVEYNSDTTQMILLCPQGHQQEVYLNTHRKGRQCTVCVPIKLPNPPRIVEKPSGGRCWTQDDIDKYLEEQGEGYTRVAEYVSYKDHLLMRCPLGHLMKRISWKGFVRGIRCRDCYLLNNKGENSPNYNRDMTPEQRERQRRTKIDDDWRNAVYARDNYTCVCCGWDKGNSLNAHHLWNYSQYPDLRRELSNGVTLCKKCHSINGEEYAFHRVCGFRNNTPEQFYQWLYYARQYLALRDLAQPSAYSLLPLAA